MLTSRSLPFFHGTWHRGEIISRYALSNPGDFEEIIIRGF
jgi:hypothetical protein